MGLQGFDWHEPAIFWLDSCQFSIWGSRLRADSGIQSFSQYVSFLISEFWNFLCIPCLSQTSDRIKWDYYTGPILFVCPYLHLRFQNLLERVYQNAGQKYLYILDHWIYLKCSTHTVHLPPVTMKLNLSYPHDGGIVKVNCQIVPLHSNVLL